MKRVFEAGSTSDDVLLNLLWLRPGLVGGTERYVTSLLEAIDGETAGLRLLVGTDLLTRHRLLIERFAHEVHDTRWGRPGRVGAERRLFRRTEAAGVHHLGGTVAAGSAVPTAVTIYDLQVFDHPDYFHPLKRRYLGWAIPRAVERADLICVMSEFVAESLGVRLGVARERCRVVPPAIAHVPAVGSSVAAQARARPYLLFPAMTWPHKRHRFLIEVIEKLTDLDLVFTGAEGPVHQEVMAAAAASSAAGRIHHLGRVSSQELSDLYSGARAVVFPSEYEGFGQPVLEAMAHGCPVVTSAHAALREAAGDAGIVLPDDPEAWAEAILSLESDTDRRRELVDRGIDRAATFSPASAASAQLGVYDELRAMRR